MRLRSWGWTHEPRRHGTKDIFYFLPKTLILLKGSESQAGLSEGDKITSAWLFTQASVESVERTGH